MELVTDSGLTVVIGPRLAAGGQGEVFAAASHPGTVFKRYLASTLDADGSLERRLQLMTAHRPEQWREPGSGHLTLAWPTEVVRDGGRFTGFLMPEVDMTRTVGLHRVTNPTDRGSATGPTSWARSFTWRYLVRIAANLAQATAALHAAGVVIGDFNDSNIRSWREARVTLLDCDSMQVRDPGTGERFFCPVGRPDFTAPELIGADWRSTVRHPSADLFALAIHIYQLLLEGEHPFRGTWTGTGDKPPVPVLASRGIWAHHDDSPLAPRRAAISATLLPPEILSLFRQAFQDGAADPVARPTAAAWHAALDQLSSQLRTCTVSPAHVYPAAHPSCPWCDYVPPPVPSPLPRLGEIAAGGTSVLTPQPGTAGAPGPASGPAGPVPAPGVPAWRNGVRSLVAVMLILAAMAGIIYLAARTSGGGGNAIQSGPTLGPAPLRTLSGDDFGGATVVAFSPSGTTIASGSELGTVNRWSVPGGHRLPPLQAPKVNPDARLPVSVTGVAFSPSGSLLAATLNDGDASVWNLATGRVTVSMTDPRDSPASPQAIPTSQPSGRPTSPTSLTAIAFSPDSTTIATGDGSGRTYLWNAATGQQTAVLTDPPMALRSIAAVTFSPDGATLATVDADGYTYLWNLTTRRITTTITGFESAAAVAFSPSGTTLATGEKYGTTNLWNTATGRETALLNEPGQLSGPSASNTPDVTAVAFSPSGGTLATADTDGYTYLWRTGSGKITRTFTDRNSGIGGVSSVAYSPDGRLLATGDNNGSIFLWKAS